VPQKTAGATVGHHDQGQILAGDGAVFDRENRKRSYLHRGGWRRARIPDSARKDRQGTVCRHLQRLNASRQGRARWKHQTKGHCSNDTPPRYAVHRHSPKGCALTSSDLNSCQVARFLPPHGDELHDGSDQLQPLDEGGADYIARLQDSACSARCRIPAPRVRVVSLTFSPFSPLPVIRRVQRVGPFTASRRPTNPKETRP